MIFSFLLFGARDIYVMLVGSTYDDALCRVSPHRDCDRRLNSLKFKSQISSNVLIDVFRRCVRGYTSCKMTMYNNASHGSESIGDN